VIVQQSGEGGGMSTATIGYRKAVERSERKKKNKGVLLYRELSDKAWNTSNKKKQVGV